MPVEIRVEIIDLWKDGLTLRFVAKSTNVNVGTAKKVLKEEGLYE